jgi:hypothetical protein
MIAAQPYDLPPQASMVIKRTVQAGASSVAAAARIMTWVFSFHASLGSCWKSARLLLKSNCINLRFSKRCYRLLRISI